MGRQFSDARVDKSRAPDRVSIFVVLLLLGAVTLATYSNSFTAGFPQDSKARILRDPRLREATVANIQRILAEDYWWPIVESGLYRPVTTLSYLFNYAVLGNGERPRGYHWVNFLLHYVNVVLVYVLARKLFERVAPAFFTAVLFAVHPVDTEAVANVAGRPDLLAASFVLGGLLIHLRAARSRGTRKLCFAVALAVTCFLGLLCKENAVVLPAGVLLLDLARGPKPSGESRAHTFAAMISRMLFAEYALMAVSVLAWLYVRDLALGKLAIPKIPFVDNPLVSADFWTAKLTAAKVLGRSLLLLAWPSTLSCDYSYDQIPLASFQLTQLANLGAVATLGVVLGLIVIALHQRRRNSAVFFFVSFLLVTILPTSNLIVPIGSIMAERFLYLPAVGYAGCLVAATYAVCRCSAFGRKPGSRPTVERRELLAATLLTLVLLGYAVRSFARNFDWSSDLRLWRKAVETSPNSFRTHLSLAYLLYSEDPERRSIDLAIQEAEKAAAIMEAKPLPLVDVPLSVFGHLGVYYSTKGDQVRRPTSDGSLVPSEESRFWYEKAVATLERAVSIDSALNQQHLQYETERGRHPSEIPDVGDQDVYYNLGIAEARLGRYQKATDAWAYLLHLAPMRIDVHVKIAALYRLQGRKQEALVALHQALLLNQSDENVLKTLIALYQELDPNGCAVLRSGERLKLNPACPAVEDHSCMAYGALVELFQDSKQFARSEIMRRHALEEQHCPPDQLPTGRPPTLK